MFIFKDSKKRANPFAQYTDADGTQYPTIPLELLEEIPDPVAPEDFSDETYYRTEQDDAPYVVYTKKSDEQLEELRKSKIKQEIAAIEAGQARAVREAALGSPQHLIEIEAKIQALRSQL
jgi:replication fork clamp-binding protein CrfC